MKEGMRRGVCASDAQWPSGGSVSATTTLAGEAMDWSERSMPPSMMKGDTGREDEEGGGVAGEFEEGRRLQEDAAVCRRAQREARP